jgi:hypothetical protein
MQSLTLTWKRLLNIGNPLATKPQTKDNNIMETGTTTTKTYTSRSTFVEFPTPRTTVAVTRVKVDLKCLTCGQTWGLWVIDGMLVRDWDTCRRCEQRRIEEQNSREIRQSYQADITGRRKEL